MSAFEWPVDKLTLINRALVQTGDDPLTVLDDGSDRFIAASAGYEDGLAVLMEESNWGFATLVVQLPPLPTPPANNAWDTQYNLPGDLLHIVWVRVNQNTTDPTTSVLSQPTLWDIEAGKLVINAQGGPPPPSPPLTPAIAFLKYVSTTFGDPATPGTTPLFVRALTAYTMAGLYRSRGDVAEAKESTQAAMVFSQQARTRYDQQKPKRQFRNSRILAARRVRHPWPPVGLDNWTGTGSAG
jgi:hypothetical protein